MSAKAILAWCLAVGLLSLTGCSPTAPPAEPAIPTATLAATADPPTATPSATPTATPTPHPLSIEYLRNRSYPASPITILETLEPGANYSRYLAQYESDGLRIQGLLTVPYSPPPPSGWPAIVFNHGYIPPEIYRPTLRYVAYVDGFARNGYVVLRPDYRGHADSDGDARGAYSIPDYVIDVLHALAAVREFEGVDPARVGMWGHSMGGYITLRSMVVDPDIRAGVIWAGVVASYQDLLTS